MSNKTVEFRQPSTRVDTFVKTGTAEAEAEAAAPVSRPAAAPIVMKRVTVDIPENLHADLKVECARLRVQNYEVVRRALMKTLEELRKLGKDEGQAWLTG